MKVAIQLLLIAITCRASLSQSYPYLTTDDSDMIFAGEVVGLRIDASGKLGERGKLDELPPTEISIFRVRVSRYLKGSGPTEIEVAVPKRFTQRASVGGNAYYHVDQGDAGIWFARESDAGDFYLDRRSRQSSSLSPDRQRQFRSIGITLGLTDPADGRSQIMLKDLTIPNRGNMYLDLAETLVHNAKIDPERRWYYFEKLTDLSPIGFGREDRSKQEQSMFKSWMDEHLTQALNPTSDAERMDEYALRIRFGQFEYCDRFTEMYVRTNGVGMTATFPPTLGTNNNGMRIYAVADPRLARELALGFMYCTELNRNREICKLLITRFGEDNLLNIGILEAVSKLMDWSDTTPYDSEKHTPMKDLTRQIEIVRFRLNN